MVSSIGRHVEPVAGEHALVVLDVVADLEHRGSTSTGRSRSITGGQVELAVAALAELVDMGQGHVEAFARRHGETDADQLRAREVERSGLGVECQQAALDRTGDDGVEIGQVGDRGEADLAAAGCGRRRRRRRDHAAGGLDPAGQ